MQATVSSENTPFRSWIENLPQHRFTRKPTVRQSMEFFLDRPLKDRNERGQTCLEVMIITIIDLCCNYKQSDSFVEQMVSAFESLVTIVLNEGYHLDVHFRTQSTNFECGEKNEGSAGETLHHQLIRHFLSPEVVFRDEKLFSSLVDVLVKKKSDINAVNDKGLTPYHTFVTVMSNFPQSVVDEVFFLDLDHALKVLETYSALSDNENQRLANILLHTGCTEMDIAKVEEALDSGAYVNCLSLVTRTQLGEQECQNRWDPNPPTGGLGDVMLTPVYQLFRSNQSVAMQKKKVRAGIIRMLGKAGADFNFTTNWAGPLSCYNCTPNTQSKSVLSLSMMEEEADAALALREFNARCTPHEMYQQLCDACHRNDEDGVTVLLTKGAPLQDPQSSSSSFFFAGWRNRQEETPLGIACRNYYQSIRDLLVRKGATNDPVPVVAEIYFLWSCQGDICEEALRRAPLLHQTDSQMNEMCKSLSNCQSTVREGLWMELLLEGAIAGNRVSVTFVLSWMETTRTHDTVCKEGRAQKLQFQAILDRALLEACGKSARTDRDPLIVRALLAANAQPNHYALLYALHLDSPAIAVILLNSGASLMEHNLPENTEGKKFILSRLKDLLLYTDRTATHWSLKADNLEEKTMSSAQPEWKMHDWTSGNGNNLDRADLYNILIRMQGAGNPSAAVTVSEQKQSKAVTVEDTASNRELLEVHVCSAIKQLLISESRNRTKGGGQVRQRLWVTLELARDMFCAAVSDTSKKQKKNRRARTAPARYQYVESDDGYMPLLEFYVREVLKGMRFTSILLPDIHEVLAVFGGILLRGADVNATNSKSGTVCSLLDEISPISPSAANYEYWSTIRMYILGKGGRGFNHDSARADQLLLDGCRRRNLHLIMEAVEVEGAYVNCQSRHNCHFNQTPLVVLVQSGRDKISQDSCAMQSLIEIITYLVKNGASVNPTTTPVTPLGAAFRHHLPQSVRETLVKFGAVRRPDEKIDRLLNACEIGDEKAVREELRDGAAPDRCIRKKIVVQSSPPQWLQNYRRGNDDVKLETLETPMYLACLHGHPDIVTILLEAGWPAQSETLVDGVQQSALGTCLINTSRVGKSKSNYDEAAHVLISHQGKLNTEELNDRLGAYELGRYKKLLDERNAMFTNLMCAKGIPVPIADQIRMISGEDIIGGNSYTDISEEGGVYILLEQRLATIGPIEVPSDQPHAKRRKVEKEKYSVPACSKCGRRKKKQ